MRHMRSRRILAMLLALSMIFGLLTTTAFAGEVDQNTSNVGESAANGTSEGGSGEGQSSGASEDESSKVTNKEDVPTEEETIPEEKKTTSDEEVDTQVGEGENPVAETNYVASIGETGYESLDAAIQAAQDNDTIVVSAGEYTLSGSLTYTNKAFMIKAADGETVSFDMSAAVALHGAKITFEGVTFNYKTNGNYIGLQHADTLVYNNCVINGMVFLYATNETFNNCTFNQTSADAYNVWTYGAKNVAFNSCTFNCVGKSVLVYNEGANAKTDLNVNDTTFNASAPVEGKAAIEIDTSLMTEGATITVDANTTADGFATGSNSGSTLWNDKKQTADTNKNTTVTVANEAVFVPKSTGVATVDGVSYDTLDAAFAALNSTNHTLTLLDESKWDVNTPVYWKAGNGEYAAAASLVEALTAAYKANAGDITIICRPGADVGEMTHGHVADNLTIYGNDAYISAGECDLEVDTFKFDRNTGKQATDGVTLDKDITITAYELDNLGVWGERHTNHTVNVNLTDCDTVQGITVQRVYISGTTGMNNITLSGCNFGTEATSVYSNADGDINITDCSFTGAQVPVNFNHKAGGEQTLRVSNCEFNACGEDEGDWAKFAAPVRFVNSGSGKQSATVDTCTFTDTVGANGDILIGDGRTGQESNDVNLTITDTEAKIQAQKPGYYKDDGTTDNALKGEKALTAGETLTVSKMEDLIGGSTGIKGSSAENAYTLEELGEMTRDAYIAAQKKLGGTMYVSVGDYSYGKDGVLGNGVRNDTPGQTEDRSVLNGYNSNGYLGEKNDGANGLNIVFVNGSITSGVTGYESIDNIGTSLLLAVPAYTNVTFKGITFNNVMSFNYQLYTGPWSQLGELKFDGCTFNGIIVGATAAQTLTFNGCTFNNYTNTTSANSSNPTWIRPAYGNWKESDNDVQGQNFKSLTTINFTNNTVASTRPVKFEFISQWNNTTTLTATGNSFDISAQTGDETTKNVGLYIGPHTDKNAVNLVLDHNTKSEGTAALYVIPSGKSKLPVGSTVTDLSGNPIEITDALEWKTDTKVTLKTEKDSTGTTNVAKVGETEYETLAQAIAAADENSTVTLLNDTTEDVTIDKNITLDLGGKTLTNTGAGKATVYVPKDVKATVKNGIVMGGASYYNIAVGTEAAPGGELTLIGVTATAGNDGSSMIDNWGTLTIESGTYTGGLNVVKSEPNAVLTITGGKFTLNSAVAWSYTGVILTYGTAKIEGGEFVQNAKTPAKASPCVVITAKEKVDDPNPSTEITGGTFTNNHTSINAKIFHGMNKATSDNFEVKGGTFNKSIPEGYCADGFIPTKNADGTYGVKEGKYVAKIGSTGYETLAAAIAKANSKTKPVTLVADVTESIEIAESKTCKIDLNGFTLTNTEGSHTIVNNGTLTIMDSSEAKSGTVDNVTHARAAIVNYGTMTLAGGTYTRSKECGKTPYDANGNSFYTILNDKGGSLTIKDGVTVTNEGHFSSMICNGNDAVEDTTLTIEGGLFSGGINTIKNGEFGKLTINGGSFTNATQCVVMNWNEASITGGTFELASGVNSTLLFSVAWSDHAIGKMTISGGTFKYTETQGLVQDTYNGGQYTGTLAVSGGTFAHAVEPKYCAEGFEPIANGNGTFGVKEISAAKIGDTEYETLAAAFAAAKDGETIVLLKNSSGDGIVVKNGTFTGKGLTVDFDGHTYTVGGVLVGSSGTASNGFQLNKDNKITFKNGALYGDASVAGDKTTNWTGAPAIMIQNYSNLTLEKMTVVGGKETCYTISNNCGDTLIKNSTITAGEASTKPAYQPARAFDVCGFSTYPGATVTVENSTINGAVEISNGNNSKVALTIGKGTTVSGSLVDGGNGDKVAVTKDKSVDVAAPDGYKWVDGENGQTLAKIVMVAEVNGKQYEALQAAIDAAKYHETVTLLSDTRENVTVTGKSKVITLDLAGHILNGGTVANTPALTVSSRANLTIVDSSAAQTGTIMREDTAANSGVSSHYVIDIQDTGSQLTFKSGNVKNNSGNADMSKGASLIRIGNDNTTAKPQMFITGGTFTQDNFIAIKVDRGTLTMNGGEIDSQNTYAVENWYHTTINDGTINGKVSSWVWSGGNNKDNNLSINGGTIHGDIESVTYDGTETKTAKITINGGVIDGKLLTRDYNKGDITDATKATIGVVAGNFREDPTKFLVEGSTVSKNDEGRYDAVKAYLCKIGEKSYYTMDEALKAVKSGETIVLLRDCSTNKQATSGTKDFTIDLAEFTWNHTGSSEIYSAFEANNENGKITVKNGNVVSNQPIGLVSWDNAGLVFDTVKMTTTGRSGIETNGNNTNDTVTLKNSTLNVPNGFGIYFPSSGTLTIDNSVINAKTMGVQVCSGSLNITGADTKIEVTGDGVEKTENDGAIQDGAAISIVNRTGYKGLGTIAVAEGTFTAKSGNEAVKAYDWSNKEPGEANFTASDKVAISGGTYSTPVAANLCAEGFVPKDNGNGTYGVQPDGNVAEIGSVKYTSLDEALKAAKDRETVKLLKDVEATQVLVTKGTLDLNGKTLKVSYFMSFSDVIDSTEGNGLIETGVQSFFTTNNSHLPLRDSAANGYRLFSYQLNKLGIVKGSPTAFWFNIVFGGEKAYSLLNTAGHNADLFIPMQIGSGNEWQYIKMNQSTLRKWTTPILNGTAPSKCGYYVNITGLDTLTSGTVLTLKTSIRSCGVEKLSDDSLTYTVK